MPGTRVAWLPLAPAAAAPEAPLLPRPDGSSWISDRGVSRARPDAAVPTLACTRAGLARTTTDARPRPQR